MVSLETIPQYWFGSIIDEKPVPAERLKFWFAGTPQNDMEIRALFLPLLSDESIRLQAQSPSSPGQCLSLILLYDQFSRNIFRNSAQAYAFDDLGLNLCRRALENGWTRSMKPIEKAFAYLPLEHSENQDDQRRCVELFISLLDEAPVAQRESFEGFLDYARRHREIIERFGRFPHRNRALGRRSTPEEESFLKTPGSSF